MKKEKIGSVVFFRIDNGIIVQSGDSGAIADLAKKFGCIRIHVNNPLSSRMKNWRRQDEWICFP